MSADRYIVWPTKGRWYPNPAMDDHLGHAIQRSFAADVLPASRNCSMNEVNATRHCDSTDTLPTGRVRGRDVRLLIAFHNAVPRV